jgi:CMP-N,N'-diacetyllegionaminic acid synthase
VGERVIRLCTICARGGSQGIPSKNIRLLGGRPLIAHSIAQARDSGLFDAVAVSSDATAILEVARDAGADILVERPAELATHLAAKVPAIRHCVESVEAQRGRRYDVVVDLDATSPLRAVSDIQGAVALLERTGVSNVITASPARRSPYFNLVEVGPDDVVRLSKPPVGGVVRRQDAPPCFDMNASIYVWQRRALADGVSVFLEDTRLFVMPEERSLDIDSPLDFAIVEFLMGRG